MCESIHDDKAASVPNSVTAGKVGEWEDARSPNLPAIERDQNMSGSLFPHEANEAVLSCSNRITMKSTKGIELWGGGTMAVELWSLLGFCAGSVPTPVFESIFV